MDSYIVDFVKNCSLCDDSDKVLKPQHSDSVQIQVPDIPWDKIAIDILGPCIGISAQKIYILVAIDYFSKWVEYKWVNQTDSLSVITFLKEILKKEGLPLTIV